MLPLGCSGDSDGTDAGGGGEGSLGESRGTPLEEVEPFEGDGPIEIVCTTGMVADLVRNVGGRHVANFVVVGREFPGDGERIVVRQLYGAGIDPHTHRPTPGDTRVLAAADVIVYSGLHLEGTLTETFENLARRKVVYPVTADLDSERLLVDEAQHDPHAWMDVALWSEAAANVATLLSKLDPDRAEDYAANLKTYRAELAELDTYVRDRIATLPEEQRVLVTAHDAFAYFSRAYGITVRSVQGISTESEASVRDVNDLVDFLVKRRIKSVFVETSVNERNVKSLVEGCASRGHTVTIGGELYSDALGEPDEPGGTYVGMIRHNVDTIVGALK